MSNQDNNGVNNGANGGSQKQKKSIGAWVKEKAKKAYVWVTTSKAGRIIGGGGIIGLSALGAKMAYDNGFKKGAASVTPTTVYITAGVEEDPEDEDQEPVEEEPVVEETTAE